MSAMRTTNWAALAKAAPKDKEGIPEVSGSLEFDNGEVVIRVKEGDLFAALYTANPDGTFSPRMYTDKDGKKRESRAFKLDVSGSFPEGGTFRIFTGNRSVLSYDAKA